MKIRLHLGAHRTGTTTLQSILRKQDRVLLEHGIRALTCWGFGDRTDPGLRVVSRLAHDSTKKGAIGRYFKIKSAKRELSRQIGTVSPSVLLLSDENFLGKPISVPDGASVYPNSLSSLKACSRSLPVAPDRVHVTVRDYASFLTSAYAMAMVYGSRKVAFDEVKTRALRVEHRWSRVLRDVRHVFPTSNVTFAVFEDTPIESSLDALLSPELQLGREAMQVPKQNSSPTYEALEATMESGPMEYAVADALILKHAGGTTFDPLSESEKFELSDLYAEDLALIREEFLEVSLAKP